MRGPNAVDFLLSKNYSPCKGISPRPWTLCQATRRDTDINNIYSLGIQQISHAPPPLLEPTRLCCLEYCSKNPPK
eukprot:1144426-Pelagomonas_calceolata.AAC.1